MSKRRASSRPEPVRPGAPCPCGLAATYQDCCGRLHRGEAQAKTAEELMRSRFSAFAVQDAAYLLKSWHPGTRPARIDFEPDLQWQRLEIVRATAGSPFHTEGTVEFRAHYTRRGQKTDLHETSRFVRHGGQWVYLDGSSGGGLPG